MDEYRAGGFEYQGKAHRFKDARCRWEPGELFIEAEGKRCGLRLVGVPFPGASGIPDLVGRVWDPDDDERALHADTFAEGGLDVRDLTLWIVAGRITVRRFDPERQILSIAFRLTVQDDHDGEQDEADGVAHCRVIEQDPVE